jgi:hypothetical protein
MQRRIAVRNFDSYYDPPEVPEPPPQSEQAREILEAAGVEEAVIAQICDIVETLAYEASRDCATCDRRAAEIEAETERLSMDAWKAIQQAEADLETECPHKMSWLECDACMTAGDLAYDAARER